MFNQANFWHFLSDLLQMNANLRIISISHDYFLKFQNESRIDNLRKFENRAYPIVDPSLCAKETRKVGNPLLKTSLSLRL